MCVGVPEDRGLGPRWVECCTSAAPSVRFSLRGREMCVDVIVAGLQHCKNAFLRGGLYFFPEMCGGFGEWARMLLGMWRYPVPGGSL
jgi:hypothetical protein